MGSAVDIPANVALVGGLVCPGCGYDLRGTGGARCSECGLELDREALKVSGFAWAHRRKIGRVRAYVETVWQVAAGHAGLAHEAGKVQDATDARSFRRVTAGVVAAVMLGVFFSVSAKSGGLGWLAVATPDPSSALKPGWWQDTLVPWCAGATLWPVVPGCLVMLAVYVTGVQRAVFRLQWVEEERRERGAAIALYAGGPLALLLPAVACGAGGVWLARYRIAWRLPLGFVMAMLWMAAAALGLIAVGWTVVRVGQWVGRTRHGGTGAAALASAELLGLWVLGVAALLGVVPWCVGLLWVICDSSR